MAKQHNCPTCGTKLSPLHRAQMRACSGCRRESPVGFIFCGYCAAPMEGTDARAKVAEVAAPKGGWPDLSAEMLEVKFFLDQGELDEAYELLSILQQRYPGHPELADVSRPTTKAVAADADVEQLVDDVLASSSTLAGKAPRRRATRWDAPTVGRKEPTSVHDPVMADIAEALAEEGEPRMPGGDVPLDMTDEAKPIRERTKIYKTVGPKKPKQPSSEARQSGMTIAVDALQPARPFPVPEPPSETAETEPRAKNKTIVAEHVPNKVPVETKGKTKLKAKVSGKTNGKTRKRATKTARKRKLDANAKRKGPAFGAGVLDRFGR